MIEKLKKHKSLYHHPWRFQASLQGVARLGEGLVENGARYICIRLEPGQDLAEHSAHSGKRLLNIFAGVVCRSRLASEACLQYLILY